MKKKFSRIIILALVATMTLPLAACSGGGDTTTTTTTTSTASSGSEQQTSGEVYEFAISHNAAFSDPIHMGFSKLEELLEEKSDGRIQVTIYGNKQISSSDNENAEKVMQGIVQGTSVPTSTLATIADIKGFWVFEYPYLFETNEALYEVLDSELAQTWSEELEVKAGMKSYGGYSIGWCVTSTNTKEILTVDDLKGDKVRTMQSEIQMAIVNAFGASATVVNYSEVFTAAQQGTVDGIYTTTGLYVSDRFYEVQDYMACTNASALLHVPIVNAAWYDSLPADLQEIFDECMDEYLEAVRQYEEEFDDAALQTLRDEGMIVTEYDAAAKQTFIDATANVIVDYADIAGQDVIDAVKEMLGK